MPHYPIGKKNIALFTSFSNGNFPSIMDSDMADFLRDIRRLCDHARVNLDLSNDVYKSAKVLFALCWCEINNSAIILPLFLLITYTEFISWSMISWQNLYKHSREMDLQVLIVVILKFSFKKLYKTLYGQ